MLFRNLFILFFVFMTGNLAIVSGARILVATHTYALSHFHLLQPLLNRLADSGHHITALTFYPRSKPHPNYTDIDLRSILEPYTLDCVTWSAADDVYDLFNFSKEACETLFGSEPVQNLLKSGQQFDLVIVEAFGCESILGFPAVFNAPYVAFSTLPLPSWLADWIWNPIESSYVPDHICRATDSDTLLSRGYRVACQFLSRLTSWWINTRSSLDILQRHFHLNLQSLSALKSNVSVIFVNSVPVLGGIRPYLPNVIEIGGIHITKPNPLPKDLSDWMDGCREGVVVFSMGSMVKASTMDPKTRDRMIDILSRLKECVLWKWEENLSGLTNNIKTVAWLPQNAVLAHPNVRAFIAHGGIHGLLEAIHHSVPVIGMPLYGDQITNLQQLQGEGAGIVVEMDPFNGTAFDTALTQVLHNASYGENMRRLSRITKDVEKTPLEKAVWWIEYVLRHRGAPHLRHKGVDQQWWQYYMLDIFLAILAPVLLLKIILRLMKV